MSEFTIDRRRMTGAILGATALAAGATLGAASASAAAEVTLRFHSFVPPVSSSFKSLKAWADKVEKDSDGRLKIQLFGAMQLGGKAPDLYDQVKNGVVDIGWTLPGYKAGTVPGDLGVRAAVHCRFRAPIVSPAVDDYRAHRRREGVERRPSDRRPLCRRRPFCT